MASAPTTVNAGTPTSIDPRLYRNVLSHYPTGVVVVCAQTPAGPEGMACNSFTSVSLDPPLVAICPAKTSTTWPKLRDAGRFCISVLAAHHEPLSRLFARREIDRFAGTAVIDRPSGPGISDAAAWLDCALEAEHDAGDHSIAVARVQSLEMRTGAPALIFFRGEYGEFTPGDPES